MIEDLGEGKDATIECRDRQVEFGRGILGVVWNQCSSNFLESMRGTPVRTPSTREYRV